MTHINSTHILQSQLREYAAQDLYPMHMPGHKRRVEPAPGLPFSWDLTEVPGTDDLHDADGILREAMERTAALWGAGRTWYLVNGSTCGLLAGIRALAPQRSAVLCARNCHKAVYHALELAGYQVHWLLPPVDGKWGICGGIPADLVEKELWRHKDVRAVILTSPTYEGVLSEVGEISRICHARGIPVLVDEAHGAHLLLMAERAGFPAGALACGADLVVQSPHKTLPSLTQTALLHLQGNLVDPQRIEEELDIFETSSPSYPLMASLDGCTGLLREQGPDLFDQWGDRIGRFETQIRPLQKIRVLRHLRSGPVGTDGDAAAERRACLSLYDPGKILIDAGPAGLSGRELAEVLRKQWRIETEMAQGPLLLAMTSLCDTGEALDRLARALLAVDREALERDASRKVSGDARSEEDRPETVSAGAFAAAQWRPKAVCTLAEAAGRPVQDIPLSDAAGRICGEYLYFYPPGIPLLAPGEVITRRHLEMIADQCAGGSRLCRHRKSDTIRCLRE